MRGSAFAKATADKEGTPPDKRSRAQQVCAPTAAGSPQLQLFGLRPARPHRPVPDQLRHARDPRGVGRRRRAEGRETGRPGQRGGGQRGPHAHRAAQRDQGGRPRARAGGWRGAQRDDHGRRLARRAGARRRQLCLRPRGRARGRAAGEPRLRRDRPGGRRLAGVDFQMPAGVVVPLPLTGWRGQVEFDATGSVVPEEVAAGWRGFLPGDGHGALAWRPAQKAAEGTLFFTGSEQTDVRVGAGLLRQTSRVTLRVLQGKIPGGAAAAGRAGRNPGRGRGERAGLEGAAGRTAARAGCAAEPADRGRRARWSCAARRRWGVFRCGRSRCG